MEENIMKVNLKVWRQANPREKGGFVTYNDVETTPDTSFLETLDILNETLIEKGEEPIVFDHDCRASRTYGSLRLPAPALYNAVR